MQDGVVVAIALVALAGIWLGDGRAFVRLVRAELARVKSSKRFDRVLVVTADGQELVTHDPPWWRVDRRLAWHVGGWLNPGQLRGSVRRTWLDGGVMKSADVRAHWKR